MGRGALGRESVTITRELKEHLWSALSSLASAPISERTITGLSVLLQSNALKQALQPYTVAGPWGRLLDAETERLGEADVQAFETEGLIGAGAAPAVLAYLFHRVGDRLDADRPCSSSTKDGSPSTIPPLPDSSGNGERRSGRRMRASSSPPSRSPTSMALQSRRRSQSCPTRLFCRMRRPRTAYRHDLSPLRTNHRQIEIRAAASPKRDYYCQSRRGNRLFELGLSEVALAFTAASSKTDQAAIADLFSANGRGRFRRRPAARQGPRLGGGEAHPGQEPTPINRLRFMRRLRRASPR